LSNIGLCTPLPFDTFSLGYGIMIYQKFTKSKLIGDLQLPITIDLQLIYQLPIVNPQVFAVIYN